MMPLVTRAASAVHQRPMAAASREESPVRHSRQKPLPAAPRQTARCRQMEHSKSASQAAFATAAAASTDSIPHSSPSQLRNAWLAGPGWQGAGQLAEEASMWYVEPAPAISAFLAALKQQSRLSR